MFLALALSALAAEPAMRSDGGAVIGVVEMDVAAADVLRLVLDPVRTAKIAGNDMTITRLGADGACELLDYHVNNSVMDVNYRARMCANASGYVATLVESDDLSEYEVRLHVEDLGEGRSRITYRSLVVTKLPVPSFLMVRHATGEISMFLGNVSSWLERN